MKIHVATAHVKKGSPQPFGKEAARCTNGVHRQTPHCTEGHRPVAATRQTTRHHGRLHKFRARSQEWSESAVLGVWSGAARAWCASLLCGRMDIHRAAALRATREAGLTLGTQLDCLDQRMEHEAREEVERVARSRLAERPGLVFDRTATFNTVGYMLHGASSSASARTSPRGTPRTALASPRPARSFSSTSLPPMCPRSELQQRGPNRIPLRHLPLPEFPYSAQFSVPVDGAWRRREAPYE